MTALMLITVGASIRLPHLPLRPPMSANSAKRRSSHKINYHICTKGTFAHGPVHGSRIMQRNCNPSSSIYHQP